MARRALFLLAVVLLASCGGYRPAKLADRAPVTIVHDDEPIERPAESVFIEELYQADAYVRREVVKALDPRRTPRALDVNSFDEIPRSSWYHGVPDSSRPLLGYRRDGPPQPPFSLLDEAATQPDARRIRDARGLTYELLADYDERHGMRTSAAAIASRLVHALGYRTPEVYVIRDHEGRRVAATRWPIGVDLGPTPINRRRPDDPNDHLPHVDRRSLRALELVGAWLSLSHLGPTVLRDVYVGEPGEGHVEHYITGLEGALGVQEWEDAVAFAADPDREKGDFAFRLFSMGLSPIPPAIVPETHWPSVGLFYEHLQPERHRISPPFEPSDRLRPEDGYWIAKRIAGIPLEAIATALHAGQLEPAPTNWLFQVLHLRRAAVVAWGYDQTTPLELVTLRDDGTTADLIMADLAVAAGFVSPERRSYEVTFHDEEGEPIAPSRRLDAPGSLVALRLPRALSDHAYAVVRIGARRDDKPLPRRFEVHLRPDAEGHRIAGLRH